MPGTGAAGWAGGGAYCVGAAVVDVVASGVPVSISFVLGLRSSKLGRSPDASARNRAVNAKTSAPHDMTCIITRAISVLGEVMTAVYTVTNANKVAERRISTIDDENSSMTLMTNKPRAKMVLKTAKAITAAGLPLQSTPKLLQVSPTAPKVAAEIMVIRPYIKVRRLTVSTVVSLMAR